MVIFANEYIKPIRTFFKVVATTIFLETIIQKHFLGIIFSKVMALLVSLGLFHALVAMSIIIISI